MYFGESLLALALFPRPMGPREAILLHGVRRTAHASGLAHTFAFEGRAGGGVGAEEEIPRGSVGRAGGGAAEAEVPRGSVASESGGGQAPKEVEAAAHTTPAPAAARSPLGQLSGVRFLFR